MIRPEASITPYACADFIFRADVILKALQEHRDGQSTGPLQSDRRNILAAISKGELLEFAIDHWRLLSEVIDYDTEEADESGAFECSSYGNGISKAVVTQMASHNLPAQVAAEILLVVEEIRVAVDSLFSILPSLRSIRQSRVLDLDSLGSGVSLPNEIAVDQTPAEVPARKSVTPKSPVSSPSHSDKGKALYPPEKAKPLYTLRVTRDKTSHSLVLEDTLRLAKSLEEALRNDEEYAKSHDLAKGASVLSPEMTKQRGILEKYREAFSGSVGNRDIPAREAEVALQLNKALKKTVDTVIMPDLTTYQKNSDWEFPSSDDMEKTIKEMLGVFEKSNSALTGRVPSPMLG